MSSAKTLPHILIRRMEQSDLPAADRVFRLAFGTLIGLAEPTQFAGDADFIRTRWLADPTGAFAAFDSDRLVGSVIAIRWGSFGYFGPLTIDPEYWDRRVAQLLLEPVMETFRSWRTRHMGLYTFAQSAKHNALYRKFGFWPRDLVANLERPVNPGQASAAHNVQTFSRAATDQVRFLAQCREIAAANFDGLDLTQQIESTARLRLGDTLLIPASSKSAAGFALCYTGAGTEAGTGVCLVKFAAVWPGETAGEGLFALVEACHEFAVSSGASKLTVAVNMSRREAFSLLVSTGFKTEMQGLAMETGNEHAGYNHSGVYILDDWR